MDGSGALHTQTLTIWRLDEERTKIWSCSAVATNVDPGEKATAVALWTWENWYVSIVSDWEIGARLLLLTLIAAQRSVRHVSRAWAVFPRSHPSHRTRLLLPPPAYNPARSFHPRTQLHFSPSPFAPRPRQHLLITLTARRLFSFPSSPRARFRSWPLPGRHCCSSRVAQCLRLSNRRGRTRSSKQRSSRSEWRQRLPPALLHPIFHPPTISTSLLLLSLFKMRLNASGNLS